MILYVYNDLAFHICFSRLHPDEQIEVLFYHNRNVLRVLIEFNGWVSCFHSNHTCSWTSKTKHCIRDRAGNVYDPMRGMPSPFPPPSTLDAWICGATEHNANMKYGQVLRDVFRIFCSRFKS